MGPQCGTGMVRTVLLRTSLYQIEIVHKNKRTYSFLWRSLNLAHTYISVNNVCLHFASRLLRVCLFIGPDWYEKHCLLVLVQLGPGSLSYICGTMAKGSNCYTFPIQLEPFAMVPQICNSKTIRLDSFQQLN
jgi:hypothetical protein